MAIPAGWNCAFVSSPVLDHQCKNTTRTQSLPRLTLCTNLQTSWWRWCTGPLRIGGTRCRSDCIGTFAALVPGTHPHELASSHTHRQGLFPSKNTRDFELVGAITLCNLRILRSGAKIWILFSSGENKNYYCTSEPSCLAHFTVQVRVFAQVQQKRWTAGFSIRLGRSSLVMGLIPTHPFPEAIPNPNPTLTQTLDLTQGRVHGPQLSMVQISILQRLLIAVTLHIKLHYNNIKWGGSL